MGHLLGVVVRPSQPRDLIPVGILFDDACAEIKAAGVVFDIPADLPALNRLATLADRVEGRGFPDASAALLAPTVRVGNVTLHRLTIGAECFLRESVLPWFEDESERLFDLATAFVFAHANAPDVLATFAGDRAGFLLALRKWARTVKATPVQLVAALDAFVAMERQISLGGEAGEPGPAQYGPLIECLCREYGHDARHWLWVATIAEVDTILGARMARAVQDAQAQGPIKGVAPDPDRPDLRALRELRAAVADFKSRGAK